jgi:hypothetical protein
MVKWLAYRSSSLRTKSKQPYTRKVGINGAVGTIVARGLFTMYGSPRLARTAETPTTKVSHEDKKRRPSKTCILGLYRCRPIRRIRIHRSPYLVRPKQGLAIPTKLGEVSMNTPILNCEIGDIIEYQPFDEMVGLPFLAIIIGEDYRRGHDRWLVLPLGRSNSTKSRI